MRVLGITIGSDDVCFVPQSRALVMRSCFQHCQFHREFSTRRCKSSVRGQGVVFIEKSQDQVM
jgi:hypothetical protein